MSSVFVRSYNDLTYDRAEILRYAGCENATEEIAALMEECIKEAESAFSYKVCYGIFNYNGESDSKALSKNLQGCSRIILFAATVGITIDRMILKYSKISPAKALMLQAIGAERIESLCDAFCEDMKVELKCELRPRFSAGYGDLPIEVQRNIFRVLDCPKRIGLTLNDSLLMSPTKSVTAIVGIKDEL